MTHYKVWDEIAYPFPSFNGATIEVWEWVSHSGLHFPGNVITYPCSDEVKAMLVEGTPVVSTVTDHSGHKPERLKPKRPHTETTTNRKGHRPEYAIHICRKIEENPNRFIYWLCLFSFSKIVLYVSHNVTLPFVSGSGKFNIGCNVYFIKPSDSSYKSVYSSEVSKSMASDLVFNNNWTCISHPFVDAIDKVFFLTTLKEGDSQKLLIGCVANVLKNKLFISSFHSVNMSARYPFN